MTSTLERVLIIDLSNLPVISRKAAANNQTSDKHILTDDRDVRCLQLSIKGQFVQDDDSDMLGGLPVSKAESSWKTIMKVVLVSPDFQKTNCLKRRACDR